MKQKLIPLTRLPAEVPEWPFSPWTTGYMIRRGELGCVRVGRRIFVTHELLDAFVIEQTVLPV